MSPLLEKLTSGKTAQLISPDYTDLTDPRPIFDWQQVIRNKGIVYIGLDALSDPEVAILETVPENVQLVRVDETDSSPAPH